MMANIVDETHFEIVNRAIKEYISDYMQNVVPLL